MKVLQLSKYYPPAPGGIESFVGDLSHALTAQGHENVVLAHRHDKDEQEETTGPMGRVMRAPTLGEMMYAPIAPTYPYRLSRLLRSFKPDMVLAHMPNLSVFWALPMRLPCPLVVYWHSDVLFPEDKPLHRFAYQGYRIFEKLLLKKASRIIASSEPYLQYSKPLRPFHAKCEVIPLGIDTNRIPALSDHDVREAKRKFFKDADARYVYAAGRFAHYKGFDKLVEAAALVRATHPDLKFLIGGDGETRPAILEQIEKMGLDGQVVCPGRLSDHDYWALMKGCEMFCLPSTERTEAFGVVLLEAMAMGKPCISTAIPGSGTGWVNRHGETGLVVQAGNPQALAEGIRLTLSKEWEQNAIKIHFGLFRIENATALMTTVSP